MEQKRRGRPPKVNVEQIAENLSSINEVLGENRPSESEPMSAIALRIWESQSPDLNPRERVARVKSRLIKMGFDCAGLTLPCDEKYLNA